MPFKNEQMFVVAPNGKTYTFTQRGKDLSYGYIHVPIEDGKKRATVVGTKIGKKFFPEQRGKNAHLVAGEPHVYRKPTPEEILNLASPRDNTESKPPDSSYKVDRSYGPPK